MDNNLQLVIDILNDCEQYFPINQISPKLIEIELDDYFVDEFLELMNYYFKKELRKEKLMNLNNISC
jgi:hypothetical protein